jgi:Ca2+-transporting ATPase
MKQQIWHSTQAVDVLRFFKTSDKSGLSEEDVLERKDIYGENKISKQREWRYFKLVKRQLESPLVIVLLVAGFITLVFLKDTADAIIIAIAIAINTVIGVIQEGRASRAFDTLRGTLTKRARVIRDGALHEIDATELVPGDILEIGEGMSVEADARIISAKNLVMNEASLTGEWIGQEKVAITLPERTALFDRVNMLYGGTLCESGIARGVVVSTGAHTEVGKISSDLRMSLEEHTPFQKSFVRLARFIGISVICISILFFAVGIMRGESLDTMFLMSVALAVSAVPEGLPIAMTVILALGMERILKRGGLLKHLKSAETLGSASIILTDKTGTLTQGIMEVSHVLPLDEGNEAKDRLLQAATVTSSAFIENPEKELSERIIRGSATDKALLLAGLSSGITKNDFELTHTRIDFFPFERERKFAAAIYQNNKSGEYAVFLSGAPEALLECSTIGAREKKEAEDIHREIATQGSRLIACAYKTSKSLPDKNRLCEKLTFLGYIGFHDPLRPDAKKALRIAEVAGIRPVIVTGDHRLTAQTIARELEFDGKDDSIIEGDTFEKNEVDVAGIDIFARVLPHQKLSIVQAWQKKGEVVAMTGDGVNDAPALMRADIGIALGSGTEVAKEASDLILLDNNFSTIIAAIEEGRTIIDNVRKVITFLLATGFTEVILIGGALFMGLPMPILPAHILWINLVGEGFFNFAFAFEEKEKDALTRKPTKGVLFTSEMKALIIIVGVISDFFLLAIFTWLLRAGLPMDTIRTIMFAGLATDSFFFVFSLRSMRRPIWNINFFSNPYLLFAVSASALLLIPAVLFPPLQQLIHTVPLSLGQWGIVAALGIVDLVFIEAVKYYFIARKRTG